MSIPSSGSTKSMDAPRKNLHSPPQVESKSCYCRVEIDSPAGIPNPRFIPKHCTQPVAQVVNPSPRTHHHHRSSISKSSRSSSSSPSQLIPGLPDDLAISCLVRVPRLHHRPMRTVCRRWHRLLSGNFFYTQRSLLGLCEPWIYVIKRDREGKISWHAFDPRHQLWQPLPPIPSDYSEALGFGCAVLSGCHLYLFGGKDPLKGSMRRVIFYSARTNRWHRAPEMLRRRHFFGSAVINNCLYVAGGECEGVQRSLRSAEVFDPGRNRWSFVADMSTSMVPFIGVVFEGNWYVKGLGSHRQVMSEVYIPNSDTWSQVVDGMVLGWRNPSASLGGKLYALDCPDGCKLRVYDGRSDAWRRSVDSKAHLGNSRAVEAAALLALDGKLCIVRNNMSISVVDVEGGMVSGENSGGGGGVSGSSVQWETISGKGQWKTFVTNLLSNIAGRNRLRSHIVHCQVLQA